MEYANALKFINSYNRIEAQLKLMYRTKPTQNFTDLVKRCSDQNLTVRRYAAELTDYGKLRNAIVHRTMRGDQFIANPCDEVVESIAAIEKQICTPPRVMDAFKVKRIVHVFADSSLAEAFAKFSEGRRKEPARLPRRKTGGDPQSLYLNGKTVRVIAKRGRTSPRISTIPAAAIFWTKPNWETIGLWERTPISSKYFRRLKPKST